MISSVVRANNLCRGKYGWNESFCHKLHDCADTKSQGIGAIDGYPEDGDNAWRASNDQAFISAVDAFNKANDLKEGDAEFWTAKELKAQAMVESGNSKEAFQKGHRKFIN